MRIVASIRTFLSSYVVPGWGLWIVGKRKFAVATLATLIGLVVIFSWSRLVLNPVAYMLLIGLIIGLVFITALYSAILEFKRDGSSPPKNWKSAFAFALVGGVILYLALSDRSSTMGYDIYKMPSSSMSPTLVRGDYILTDSWSYSDSDIQFGEIVVFEKPGSDSVMYVKRVVGLPGDTLEFEENTLTRNGVPVDEPYAIYAAGSARPMSSFAEFKVRKDEYFVVGDNRDNSHDSRYFGAVQESAVVGRVVHIWYSNDGENGIQWQRFPAVIGR